MQIISVCNTFLKFIWTFGMNPGSLVMLIISLWFFKRNWLSLSIGLPQHAWPKWSKFFFSYTFLVMWRNKQKHKSCVFYLARTSNTIKGDILCSYVTMQRGTLKQTESQRRNGKDFLWIASWLIAKPCCVTARRSRLFAFLLPCACKDSITVGLIRNKYVQGMKHFLQQEAPRVLFKGKISLFPCIIKQNSGCLQQHLYN